MTKEEAIAELIPLLEKWQKCSEINFWTYPTPVHNFNVEGINLQVGGISTYDLPTYIAFNTHMEDNPTYYMDWSEFVTSGDRFNYLSGFVEVFGEICDLIPNLLFL